MKPGQVHEGRVFATATWGIYLDVQGVHVLVHVSDVDWAATVGCTEYAKVGDVLEVKILRVIDATIALGWLRFSVHSVHSVFNLFPSSRVA